MKNMFSNNIMKLTLMFFILALQTNETAIKIDYGYAGCEKSFSGFPLEEGNGVINYVCCVAQSFIKGDNLPWTIIPKSRKKFALFKEKIRKDFEKILDDEKLRKKAPEINNRLVRKRRYIKDNSPIRSEDDDEIPEEYKLGHWTTFMPPLLPIKQANIRDVSPNFIHTLLNDMQKGNNVSSKIETLKAKINTFSLAIQHSIQEIVKKEPMLLNTFDRVPFLENSCCNVDDESTLKYFVDKDKQIKIFNEKIKNHMSIINRMYNYQRAPFLIRKENTKKTIS